MVTAWEQPVPMPNNLFCEEILYVIQPESPLALLEAVPSCPVTDFLGQGADPHLATTSFKETLESHKVSPDPFFL